MLAYGKQAEFCKPEQWQRRLQIDRTHQPDNVADGFNEEQEYKKAADNQQYRKDNDPENDI